MPWALTAGQKGQLAPLRTSHLKDPTGSRASPLSLTLQISLTDFQNGVKKLPVVSVNTNGDEHFYLLFWSKDNTDLPSGINSVGLFLLAELLSYCDYIFLTMGKTLSRK